MTKLCLLVQVETRTAMANIEAIAAVEGVDGVFIGPNDLAADMGYLGNWQHPEVWKVMEDAAKRIRKAGKAPGILVGEADGQRCLDMGYLFVAVGSRYRHAGPRHRSAGGEVQIVGAAREVCAGRMYCAPARPLDISARNARVSACGTLAPAPGSVSSR